MKKFYSCLLLLLFMIGAQNSDAQTLGWEESASFPGAARHDAVSFVINDLAYVGTGSDGGTYYNDFYKFDPVTNQWTAVANFPGEARYGAVAFVLDGKAYVGTGKGASTYYQDFYAYDPATDSWTTVADYPGGIRAFAVAFSANSHGFVGTGRDADAYKSDFFAYDPSTDSWSVVAGLGSGLQRAFANAFSINDKGYITSGTYFDGSSSTVYSDVQEYDPVTNSWTEKIFADVKLSNKNGSASFVLNNEAYLVAGNSNNTVIKYNPADNSLATMDAFGPSSEDERFDPVAFAIGDKGYAGLGYFTPDFFTSEYRNDLWVYGEIVPPLAPSNLQLDEASLTKTSATVSWTDNASDETAYTLELIQGTSTQKFTLDANSNTYDFTGLTEGTSYTVKVYAKRANVNSAAIQLSFSTKTDIPAPDMPANLTLEQLGATFVVVSWDSVENVDGYKVMVYDVAAGSGSGSIENSGVTEYNPSYLDPEKEYRIEVSSVKDGKYSVANSITFTTLAQPLAPRNLSVQVNDLGEQLSFNLSWQLLENMETSVVVERSVNTPDAFEKIATLSASAQYYEDNTVFGRNDSIYYRVYGVNDSGATGYSNSEKVFARELAPVVILSNISQRPNGEKLYGSLTISGVRSATFIYQHLEDGVFISKDTVGSNHNRYPSVYELDSLVTRVIAINPYGADTSELIQFGPALIPPYLLNPHLIDATTLGFTFKQTEKEKVLFIERSENGAGFEPLDTLTYEEQQAIADLEVYHYFNEDLTPGSSYAYRMFSTKENFRSVYSDTIALSTLAESASRLNWKPYQESSLDSALNEISGTYRDIRYKTFVNGKIYLFSITEKVLFVYDFETKRVERLPDFPADNQLYPKLFEAQGNYLYVAPRHESTAEGWIPAPSLYIFDMEAKAWLSPISVPEEILSTQQSKYATVINEKVYLLNDREDRTTALGIYDPALQSWEIISGEDSYGFYPNWVQESADSLSFISLDASSGTVDYMALHYATKSLTGLNTVSQDIQNPLPYNTNAQVAYNGKNYYFRDSKVYTYKNLLPYQPQLTGALAYEPGTLEFSYIIRQDRNEDNGIAFEYDGQLYYGLQNMGGARLSQLHYTGPAILAKPMNLAVTENLGDRLKLEWIAVGQKHSGYVVTQFEQGVARFVLDTLDATATSYMATELVPERVYNHSVYAYSEQEVSDKADIWVQTIRLRPYEAKQFYAEGLSASTARFYWELDDRVPAASVNLRLQDGRKIEVPSPQDTTIVVDGLNENELLQAELELSNMGYITTTNIQQTGRTLLNTPALTAIQTDPSMQGIRLVWEDHSEHESEYLIEYKLPEVAQWDTLNTVSANTSMYHWAEVDADYEYRLKAVLQSTVSNASEYSNVLYAGTDTVLGYSEEEKQQFKVYPNPARELVKVQALYPITTIALYNLLGEKMDVEIENHSMRLEDLPQGIYLIKISAEKGVVTKRLIVQ